MMPSFIRSLLLVSCVVSFQVSFAKWPDKKVSPDTSKINKPVNPVTQPAVKKPVLPNAWIADTAAKKGNIRIVRSSRFFAKVLEGTSQCKFTTVISGIPPKELLQEWDKQFILDPNNFGSRDLFIVSCKPFDQIKPMIDVPYGELGLCDVMPREIDSSIANLSTKVCSKGNSTGNLTLGNSGATRESQLQGMNAGRQSSSAGSSGRQGPSPGIRNSPTGLKAYTTAGCPGAGGSGVQGSKGGNGFNYSIPGKQDCKESDSKKSDGQSANSDSNFLGDMMCGGSAPQRKSAGGFVDPRAGSGDFQMAPGMIINGKEMISAYTYVAASQHGGVSPGSGQAGSPFTNVTIVGTSGHAGHDLETAHVEDTIAQKVGEGETSRTDENGNIYMDVGSGNYTEKGDNGGDITHEVGVSYRLEQDANGNMHYTGEATVTDKATDSKTGATTETKTDYVLDENTNVYQEIKKTVGTPGGSNEPLSSVDPMFQTGHAPGGVTMYLTAVAANMNVVQMQFKNIDTGPGDRDASAGKSGDRPKGTKDPNNPGNVDPGAESDRSLRVMTCLAPQNPLDCRKAMGADGKNCGEKDDPNLQNKPKKGGGNPKAGGK